MLIDAKIRLMRHGRPRFAFANALNGPALRLAALTLGVSLLTGAGGKACGLFDGPDAVKIEEGFELDGSGSDSGDGDGADPSACAGYAIYKETVNSTFEGTCITCHGAGQGRSFEVTTSTKTNYANAKDFISANPDHSCEQNEIVARNISGGGYPHPLATFESDLEAYGAVCDWIAAEIANPCE